MRTSQSYTFPLSFYNYFNKDSSLHGYSTRANNDLRMTLNRSMAVLVKFFLNITTASSGIISRMI